MIARRALPAFTVVAGAALVLGLLAACSDRDAKPPAAGEAPPVATALAPTSSPPPTPASPSAAESAAPSGEAAAEIDRTPLGTFEGTLACADCAGIRTELTLYLQPDTFVLRETYLGRPDGEKTVTTEGRWEAALGIEGEPDATVIRLGPDEPESMRMFREAGGDRLEPLDRSGRPIAPEQARVLVRRPVEKEGS